MRNEVAERAIAVLVVAAAALLVLAGWKALWFQCDDAYIAFRYVSNARFGWGFTWNPPPWRPVEGYTSFLWVMLLDFAWTTLGIAPDRAANPMSLACGLATFAIVADWAWRLVLPPRLEASRLLLFALIVLGVAANRTFLMWTSSGLETSLQTLLIVTWTRLLVRAPPGSLQAGGELWALAVVGVASSMALVRPDGLLFCAVSAGLLIARLVRAGREGWLHPADLACAWPFALPIAHLLWRHATYGYWLPNTWYAKHLGASPLNGSIYLGVFLLEYGLWIEVGLAAVAIAAVVRERGWPTARDVPAIAGVGAVLAHFAFYTFDLGGDHFEWRIYQHVIPLSLLAFPWFADRAGLGRRGAPALMAVMLALGLYIPWGSWMQEVGATSEWPIPPRWQASQHLPLPLRWYGWLYDEGEGWLTGHFSANRWQMHVALAEHFDETLPPREEGMSLAIDSHPSIMRRGVGMVGWRLPRVAILDEYGLNDRVVARNARKRSSMLNRRIAHDRRPPTGYFECFAPNVEIVGPAGARHVQITPRDPPLTDADVVECETTWLAAVEEAAPGAP
jgi:arabinofuranosyltransferase